MRKTGQPAVLFEQNVGIAEQGMGLVHIEKCRTFGRIPRKL